MDWQIVIKKPWGTFVTNVHKSPEFGYLLKIKDPENIEPYKPYYLQVNFHESEILFRQLLHKMTYDCTQILHLLFKTHLTLQKC